MAPRSRRADRLLRWSRRFLRVLRPLVPHGREDEWVAEWESELWHRLDEVEQEAPVGPGAALRLAGRMLGALPHALWLRRDEWRLDMIGQDLLYAWRSLRKRPGFIAVVVVTLALGIGANTAMFTIVNSVLLQPLPFEQPDQLVSMNGSFPGGDLAAISPPDFLDYRAGNTVFSSFAGRVAGTALVTGDGDPERVGSWMITSNWFTTLGIAPLMGRAFLPEEEEGVHDVVVLSYGFWKRRFGGDPNALQRTLMINGRTSAIVGVMPAGLDRSFDVQVWRPMTFHGEETSVRRFHFMRALGRLKPGVSLEAARTGMDVIARQLEQTYPENKGWKLRLRSYREVVVGDISAPLLILLGAVGVVLLIACGNVASLQLARATSRQGEIALRTALGASRTRIIRQLLTESLLLSAAGGAVGLTLAWVLVRGVRVMAAGFLPRLAEVRIDPTVLLFTGVVSIGTGLLFGLAPATHAARANLAGSLSSLGRSLGSRVGGRARDVLVAAQMALSLVLLIGAGLLILSLWRLQHIDPGFDARGVVTAEVSLSPDRYKDRPAQLQFVHALLDRFRAMPGVTGAATASVLPLIGGGDTYFYIEGQPPASAADRRNAAVNLVSDRYFETMKIPLVTGRVFGTAERSGGPNAIVVSRNLAARLFPGGAVGKRLVVDFGKPFAGEIVGVVADVKSYGFDIQSPETMYFSADQPGGFGLGGFRVVVRSSGANPESLVAPMRAELAGVDRELAMVGVQPLDLVVAGSMSQQRFGTRLLGGFAFAALLLAVVGLYGVLAYAVAQRTRELGIRLALGAKRAQVFGLVIRRGMLIVAGGTVLGLAGAFAATRLVQGMLFQVAPTEPVIFVLVTLTLAVAGLVACVAPARRATRVDPIVALRAEQ